MSPADPETWRPEKKLLYRLVPWSLLVAMDTADQRTVGRRARLALLQRVAPIWSMKERHRAHWIEVLR